jgi:hypothetical protein
MNFDYSSKSRLLTNNEQSRPGNSYPGKSLPSVPALQAKEATDQSGITENHLLVQGRLSSRTSQLKPFQLPVQRKGQGYEPDQKSAELKAVPVTTNVMQFWPPDSDSDDDGDVYDNGNEDYDEDISAGEEDSDDDYTEKEATVSNRSQYGYVNPTHDSKLGVELLAQGAHTPNPGSRPDSVHYLSPSRNFYTSSPTRQTDGSRRKDPGLTQGHSNVVFGHDEGASEHFNRIGHQQSPRTNGKWNKRKETFHGLERRDKSNKSGGSSARYVTPSKKLNSYEPYYKKDKK